MIEAVTENNLEEVLPLISAYQEFYKVSEISDERNRAFFSQFGPESAAGCQFLYRIDRQAIAFASVYFSFASTITSKVGVLNDLYTDSSQRGKGIGRELIEHCKAFAIQKGASRLQWTTALDNAQAQKLYDSMDTRKSTWYFYAYDK